MKESGLTFDLSDLVLGTFFLIIGGIISRYFSDRTSLSWTAHLVRIVDSTSGMAPEIVKLTYKGEVVPNLIVWKIGIWNSGNRCIDNDQFFGEDQISILVKGSRIVGVGEISSSRDGVNASPYIEDNRAVLTSIPFLDSGDWIIADLYCSESDADLDTDDSHSIESEGGRIRNAINVRCKIKGVKKPRRAIIPYMSLWDRVIMMVYSIAILIPTLWSTFSVSQGYNKFIEQILLFTELDGGVDSSLYFALYIAFCVVVVAFLILGSLGFLVSVLSFMSRSPKTITRKIRPTSQFAANWRLTNF